MDNKYKSLSVNFKKQHKEIYNWIKKHADKKGCSVSHIVRELISELKKNMEAKKNE